MRVKKGVNGGGVAESATSGAAEALRAAEVEVAQVPVWGVPFPAKIAEGGNSVVVDSWEGILGRAEGRREGVLLEEAGRGIIVSLVILKEPRLLVVG